MCGHLRKEQELAFIIKNKKSRLKVKPLNRPKISRHE